MSSVNPSKLFTASCLALIVTAMSFAIRAGILSELSAEFTLTDLQLGWINSMSVIGFPVAMMVLGLLYNYFGPKKLMAVAFIGHLLGLILTMFATGFWSLVIGAFFIGFANGSVEAACNPLIADMYPKNKTTMLNRFHVWFPGGIVIGALASALMSRLQTGWEAQIGIMLIPTAIYGWLVFKQPFPKSEHIETSTGTNIKSLFSPLYIFMILCMSLTATTELGTQQWVERLLSSSGAHPMIILALSTGLMAIGRQFAGPVIHRLNPIGVLLSSAIVSAIGIYLLSIATGGLVYLATVVFALGVCYFWPTMIGFTGEYLPKTGALGMSLMGGAGMFALSVWNPIIGGWIDASRAEAKLAGLTGEEAELAAGQGALGNILFFPLILIVAFGILFALRSKVQKAAAA
ncbi:MFS transporter [Pelagicoccus sp. SDUM812003]|uniref:MFS transporter n=1 Tax=Pelagicoccus sp. SDUM812003 TaxID=3041267 RepID=UPI00280D6F21|nr:MFS transporter [Pelagicoccus sp. SDUM812003]MDQ8203909.1 MFS transporter [Pelagicoccus sp. SDUM812003]